MKKIYSIILAASVLALALTGCNKPEPTPGPSKGESLKSNELIEAVCEFYETWEATRTTPEQFTVGTATLNLSEFLYAEAAQLVNLAAGNSGDVKYESCKAATNPDRDSYDKTEIDVKNGPADGKGVKEDIVTIAERIIAAAKEKSQIPNQTLVYRGSDALAFSTNRAVVTIARTIAAYAETGKLPETVSVEYLGATTSLKAFAEGFVKFLDVWENNVADKLSADGSHCSANNNAWERVHYIPVPYVDNAYNNNGKDQYTTTEFYTFEIEGETYTSNKCWEIAIRGLLDLCTLEGNDFLATMDDRNKAYTLGDGLSLYSAPIRKASDANQWGAYPWYENSNDGVAPVQKNGEAVTEVDINFILKCGSWHVVRAFIAVGSNNPLGMIGNYQLFGTSPTSSLVLDGYEGQISPMRELIIMARIYKYILNNNITKNVYSAIKDVKFEYDMYHQELPIIVEKNTLSFDAQPEAGQQVKFTATENWTATPVESWIHVTPTSGSAGEQTVTVTVDNNTVNETRAGSVTLAAGDYSKTVEVSQAAYIAPATATIKDFAKEYVKLLDVWQKTTGDVKESYMTEAYTGVHYIPMDTKVTVAGVDYSIPQVLEIAMRSYMLLMGYDGSSTTSKGAGNFAAVTPATLNSLMPTIVGYDYASWYMETTGNGGPIYYQGQANKVTLGLLENYSERNVNFASSNDNKWANVAGYNNSRYTADFTGCFIPGRAQMAFLNFFKYMLDNNLDSINYADNVDLVVNCTLWGVKAYDDPLAPADPTIKDFAKEYVKLLDVWQATTGNVEIYTDVKYENVHYIPMDSKVTVAGTDYSVSQCLEIAMRSYMLLMGYDGSSTTSKGAGNFAAVTPATLDTVIPTIVGYGFNWWYMETTGNGGPIRYKNEANKVTVGMLENYSERNVNFASSNDNKWANTAGYNNARYTADFSGCFIPGRAQMAFLNFYKYMLDNNLNAITFADNKDLVVACTLWGVETYD